MLLLQNWTSCKFASGTVMLHCSLALLTLPMEPGVAEWCEVVDPRYIYPTLFNRNKINLLYTSPDLQS